MGSTPGCSTSTGNSSTVSEVTSAPASRHAPGYVSSTPAAARNDCVDAIAAIPPSSRGLSADESTKPATASNRTPSNDLFTALGSLHGYRQNRSPVRERARRASGDAHWAPRGSDSERGRQRGERTAEFRISVYLSFTCKVQESEALEAQRLVELRDRWLNPPEWVEWMDEPVPGYPKRPVPRDEDTAKALKKRTLTNLYNARPQWLADAHEALDAAVATAYGWPADIADGDVLRELLALNGGR